MSLKVVIKAIHAIALFTFAICYQGGIKYMNNSSSKQTVYKQPNPPLVSICIPVYNSEKTIVSTLQSILNQTYQNLEIIIVDNASTDNTLDLIGKLTDPRIIIYKNSVNIGAEKNFSKCIELATGDYIAIFHSDDLYKQEMVQKQVQAFQENPSIGAVFTLANQINEQGEVIGEYKLPVELKNNGTYCFSEIINLILKKEISYYAQVLWLEVDYIRSCRLLT
ncbi:MAG: glycosyltransferase [Methanosarcina barkeri]|nr:glycosyltransferase [Methanosarcina sp. ERenArc_MAG2]